MSGESAATQYTDDSLAMTGTYLYLNREKDEIATNDLLRIFLKTLSNNLPVNATSRRWSAQFEAVQLHLTTIDIGGQMVSKNDGSLVAQHLRADKTWGRMEPNLPLLALEIRNYCYEANSNDQVLILRKSKRRVRRYHDKFDSGKCDSTRKNIAGLHAQQAGEMLAIMLYRCRVLKKQPDQLNRTQHTVYLIAAEQSKLYFSWAEFSPEYLRFLLELETISQKFSTTFAVAGERSSEVLNIDLVEKSNYEERDKQDDEGEDNGENDDADDDQDDDENDNDDEDDDEDDQDVDKDPKLEVFETESYNQESLAERTAAAKLVLRMLVSLEECWKPGTDMWPIDG